MEEPAGPGPESGSSGPTTGPTAGAAPAEPPWRKDLLEVGKFFLLWRGALVVVAYLALTLTQPWTAPQSSNPRFLQESFVTRLFFRYDAGWFVNIAEKGYFPGRPKMQGNTAFWPAFPYTMRAVARLTGSTIWSGVLVSNLFFFGALVVLQRLGRTWVGPEATRRAMIFYAVFPTSFYMAVPYSDAMFLFLITSAFYAYRKERYLPAALLGMLAAATRASGVFLALAFGLGWLARRRWRPWPIEPRILWFALIPLGVVAFMVLLAYTVGDPLSFASVESAKGWERKLANPFRLVPKRIWEVSYYGIWLGAKNVVIGIDLVDIAVIVGGLVLLPLTYFELGIEAAVFAAACAVLPLTTGLTSGAARYSLSIFPFFLTLGLWARPPGRERVLVVLMAGILPLYLYLYMSGTAPP